MFIKAMRNGNPCLVNTDYIVDIYEADEGFKAFALDDSGYLISQDEMKRAMEIINEQERP